MAQQLAHEFLHHIDCLWGSFANHHYADIVLPHCLTMGNI